MLDVNSDYGVSLVPANQLWESINCKDFFDGGRYRCLIRFELFQPFSSSLSSLSFPAFYSGFDILFINKQK